MLQSSRSQFALQVAEEVFSIVGRDPLIDVATSLMDAARSDRYFIDRQLYPNVDFFSGLVYRAMGFPPNFFTVLFAIPRYALIVLHLFASICCVSCRLLFIFLSISHTDCTICLPYLYSHFLFHSMNCPMI